MELVAGYLSIWISRKSGTRSPLDPHTPGIPDDSSEDAGREGRCSRRFATRPSVPLGFAIGIPLFVHNWDAESSQTKFLEFEQTCQQRYILFEEGRISKRDTVPPIVTIVR